MQEVILVMDPGIHWRTLGTALLCAIFKDCLLYMRQHPMPDEIDQPKKTNDNDHQTTNDK